MNHKLRIMLVFGGVSSEHEVSRVSVGTFLRNMSPDTYAVWTVGITRDGRWLLTRPDPDAIADGSWENDASNRKCVLSPDRSDHGFLIFEQGNVSVLPVDVVIPVLHGKNGEDGTIQGFLDLSGVPYVGCGTLASAACMDKAVANTLFDAAGVPHCAWDSCTRSEAADFEVLEQRLAGHLGYPIFVKPANAGSSVGISKAYNADELRIAIDVALKEDDKVVFERFVKGQEVESAAFGNEDSVGATLPGEVLAGADFYTYDDKYKNGVSKTVYPANLPREKLEEVRGYAIKAYRALGCTGLARCDFFVEESGRVLINEINTLPGFTAISMYPQLMAAEGTAVPQLIVRLIDDAFARAESRKQTEVCHG